MLAGYFYEAVFLPANALLCLAVALFLRNGSLSRSISRTRAWIVAVLLLLALYWLSVFYAADVEAAVVEASRLSGLLPVLLLFSSLPEEAAAKFIRQWAWAGSFLVLWGWALHLFRNGRLESTFGYANALAALLAVGCWIAVAAYREHHGKIYLALAAVQAIGLIQTGSRAVIPLFVIGSLAMLFMGRSSAVNRRRPVWLSLAAAAVPVAAAAVLIASDNIRQRFSELGWNAPEFVLRRMYWADGWSLFSGHWLFGLGAGGWETAHPNRYFVRFVHQFYLQTALDVGIVGLLVLGLLIVWPLVRYAKSGIRKPLPLLAVLLLLVHAAFDLDLIFPLCSALLFVLLDWTGRPAGHDSSAAPASPPLRGFRTAAICACLAATIGFGWLAAGYGMKSAAMRLAASDPAEAIHWMRQSARLMPWTHSAHFQLAKLYQSEALRTGSAGYKLMALEEMDSALRALPHYSVYVHWSDTLKAMDIKAK
ncbi:O-antigen ligase family protein [Cohnella fermenti]|uniref:O-antigen ligase family protein n=1 Tax=Cohnella fermenti TaxID=2565925 RepID=UPI001454C1A0|nr:O-antigen ligase family protein [Cohnella fermenti]